MVEQQQKRKQQNTEIDLKELFFVLWDKVVMILTVTVLAALAAALYTHFLVTPIYVSTSSVYVMNRQNQESTLTYSDLNAATQLTNDYEEMIKSNTVLSEVIANLGLNLSPGQLTGMISVTNPQDTRFLEISVSYPDPRTARDLSNQVASVSSEKIVELMGVEKVNIVDGANLPTAPASPDIIRNIAMAAMAGFVLACGVVTMLYMLNERICSASDIERYLGISVLGIIPEHQDAAPAKTKKHKWSRSPKRIKG